MGQTSLHRVQTEIVTRLRSRQTSTVGTIHHPRHTPRTRFCWIDLVEKNTYIVRPHYNAPHYNAVFIITRPCYGSQYDCFTICQLQIHVTSNIILWFTCNTSDSVDPKDSVIMRFTCTRTFIIMRFTCTRTFIIMRFTCTRTFIIMRFTCTRTFVITRFTCTRTSL